MRAQGVHAPALPGPEVQVLCAAGSGTSLSCVRRALAWGLGRGGPEVEECSRVGSACDGQQAVTPFSVIFPSGIRLTKGLKFREVPGICPALAAHSGEMCQGARSARPHAQWSPIELTSQEVAPSHAGSSEGQLSECLLRFARVRMWRCCAPGCSLGTCS